MKTWRTLGDRGLHVLQSRRKELLNIKDFACAYATQEPSE